MAYSWVGHADNKRECVMSTGIKLIWLLVFMPVAALGYLLNGAVGGIALVKHLQDKHRRGYWFWYSYMASKSVGCHRTLEEFNPQARQWFQFSKHFREFCNGF